MTVEGNCPKSFYSLFDTSVEFLWQWRTQNIKDDIVHLSDKVKTLNNLHLQGNVNLIKVKSVISTSLP